MRQMGKEIIRFFGGKWDSASLKSWLLVLRPLYPKYLKTSVSPKQTFTVPIAGIRVLVPCQPMTLKLRQEGNHGL